MGKLAIRIGFITAPDLSRYFPSKAHPLITHDDVVARDALVAQGHTVDPVVWGTAPASLKMYDLLIVRSPWDYMDTDEKRRGLFSWLESVHAAGIALENQLSWLMWNSDKIYLIDLSEAGAPVVPTIILPPTEQVDGDWLGSYYRKHGSFVLKPTVSAAAKDTFLIDSATAHLELRGLNGAVEGDFAAWRGERSFMVQPFISEIRSAGEWSLIYFRGHYSHAVHKLPAKGQWLVQDELGGSVVSGNPPPAVFAAAQKTVALLPRIMTQKCLGNVTGKLPLYLRVDIIESRSGPLIGELEMIEPELFFLSRYPGGKVETNRPAILRFIAALTA